MDFFCISLDNISIKKVLEVYCFKMKTRRKIVFSLLSALIIFAACIVLAVAELIPEYSEFIEKTFFTYSKPVVCLFFTAIFAVIFFVFFLLFSITKKYYPVIKKRIEKEQLAVMQELMKVVNQHKLSQLLEMLDNRKALLTYELKNKYCNHSIKYTKFIDEYIKSNFSEIEDVIRAQKSTEVEEDLEELDTPDVLNSLEIIGELESLEDYDSEVTEGADLNLIEELDNIETSAFLEDFDDREDDSIEELDELESLEPIDDVEDLEELDESDEVEELEEIEELEEVITKDPYPELLNVLNNKPIYVASSNKTFISALTDDFATVDNIFAEDLCIGTEYIHKYAPFDESFVFVPVRLEFVTNDEVEELLPLENDNCFTMTKFAEGKNAIVELTSDEEDAIVERDGIYAISETATAEDLALDPSFKNLVDSILR